MGGLLLFLFFGLWLWVPLWLTKRVCERLPSGPRTSALVAAVWILVAPLPLTGELIAKWRFTELCKSSTVRTDLSATRDRRVYLANVQETPVKSLFLNATEERWRYVDVETGRPVVSFEAYRAKGGLFFGAVPLSQGGAPLLFPEFCWPEGLNPSNYIRQIGLTSINRSELKKKPDEPK